MSSQGLDRDKRLYKVLTPLTREERIKFLARYARAFGATHERVRVGKNLIFRRISGEEARSSDLKESPRPSDRLEDCG